MGPAGSTASSCPHGLTLRNCEICRVLEGGPPAAVPARRRRPGPGRTGTGKLVMGMGGMALAGIVALVVLVQFLAVVSLVLRLAQLIGVAIVAGYIGWRLGLAAGRHGRR